MDYGDHAEDEDETDDHGATICEFSLSHEMSELAEFANSDERHQWCTAAPSFVEAVAHVAMALELHEHGRSSVARLMATC